MTGWLLFDIKVLCATEWENHDTFAGKLKFKDVHMRLYAYYAVRVLALTYFCVLNTKKNMAPGFVRENIDIGRLHQHSRMVAPGG